MKYTKSWVKQGKQKRERERVRERERERKEYRERERENGKKKMEGPCPTASTRPRAAPHIRWVIFARVLSGFLQSATFGFATDGIWRLCIVSVCFHKLKACQGAGTDPPESSVFCRVLLCCALKGLGRRGYFMVSRCFSPSCRFLGVWGVPWPLGLDLGLD